MILFTCQTISAEPVIDEFLFEKNTTVYENNIIGSTGLETRASSGSQGATNKASSK